MVRDWDRNPKGPTPMATPNTGFLMCVYGGGVREVSGYIGLTSLTSPIGHCVVAATECSCTVAMEPAVYRVVPNGCAAMGAGGLHNSVSGVTLHSGNGQWHQWV